MKRYNVRPSKAISKLSFFMGIGMCILGLIILVNIVDSAGAFGIVFMLVWLFGIGGITLYHGKNAFGENGVPESHIELMDYEKTGGTIPFDEKLRKLEELKNSGILTQAEYDKKRKEILDERW